MNDTIKLLLKLIWVLLLLYWGLAAFNSHRARLQEPALKQFLLYWTPLLIAALLLGPGKWFGQSWLRENFVAHNNTAGIIGLGLAFTGAAIACWSRYLLGRNWSLSVQQKQGHELIEQGPYRRVRHPVYAGLLLLFAGNGIIVGDYRAILAVLLVFVTFWFKLKKEEKWLTDIFGSAYIRYQQRTSALIPYLL
ncbi:isoprenylcysteine carboxylmethyltransferase family protein [Niabella terrae]